MGFLEEAAFYTLGLLIICGSVQEPGLLRDLRPDLEMGWRRS